MENQESSEAEQQPETTDDTISKVLPRQTKKPNSKLKRIVPKVLFVLTLVAAIVFAGLWWQERANNGTSQPNAAMSEDKNADADQTGQLCPDTFTHYTNKDYKLEFCHPKSWGTVAVSDESGPVAETGKLAEFTFADQSHTWLRLPTHNWKMLAGHGGCGFPPVSTAEQIDSWSNGGWSGTYGTPDETSYSWPAPNDGSNRLTHAERTIFEKEMPFLIQESISTFEYIQGVCITGVSRLDSDIHQVATAVRWIDYNDQINTPQKHVDNPNTLVSAKERADFTGFVKSIKLHQD